MGNVIILNLGVGKRGAAAISNLVRPAAILTPSCLADFSTPSVYQVPCHLIPTSVRAWGGREGGKSDSAVGRTIRSRWLFRSAHPRSITRWAARTDMAEVS